MEFNEEKEQLNDVKTQLLDYLFESNEKTIKKWNKNKPVITNGKWNFMLSYPYDFNKFRDNEITKSDLANKIIELLVANTSRIIHPGLMILCWEDLADYVRPGYCYTNSGEPDFLTISSGPKLEKLRYQIRVSWEIYIGLLTDNKIREWFDTYLSDELLCNFKTKLFFNFQIEKMVRMNLNIYESCNVRFNDLCLDLQVDDKVYYSNVDKKLIEANILDEKEKNSTETQIEYRKKIIVEINESHHVPVVDNLRKLNIYQITGRLSVDYPVAEMNFKTVYKKILKEIGKILYKYYSNAHGISFYMCCVDNFDIQYVPHFWEIYEKTVLDKSIGITVEEVLQMLKSLGLTKIPPEEKIMEELDQTLSFVNFNEENFYQSTLSNVGVDQLLLLPKKKHFYKKIELVTQYTNFREKVFNSIIEFFNVNEESTYVFKLCNHINQMTEISENIIKPVIGIISDKLTPEAISAIESTYKIKLLKPLPFLMKSPNKFDSVDKQGLSNVVAKPLVEIIQKKFEPGLPTIDFHRFLPSHVVLALLSGTIGKENLV